MSHAQEWDSGDVHQDDCPGFAWKRVDLKRLMKSFRLEITQLEEQKVDEASQPSTPWSPEGGRFYSSSRFQTRAQIPAWILVAEMSGVDAVADILLVSAPLVTISRDAALPARLFDPQLDQECGKIPQATSGSIPSQPILREGEPGWCPASRPGHHDDGIARDSERETLRKPLELERNLDNYHPSLLLSPGTAVEGQGDAGSDVTRPRHRRNSGGWRLAVPPVSRRE
ncbi:hypothetical protein DUI87_28080 [Hirundo rustica rustica]|uniref:Uncharacterized protein n=1 Tax=Hirundo rustica rustica TaxID=333673 RepID=A0A3M0J318_HIRRU|nr:hypothetical protein DUI87_28080 [Hirundo rustica rustica]